MLSGDASEGGSSVSRRLTVTLLCQHERRMEPRRRHGSPGGHPVGKPGGCLGGHGVSLLCCFGEGVPLRGLGRLGPRVVAGGSLDAGLGPGGEQVPDQLHEPCDSAANRRPRRRTGGPIPGSPTGL